jgi:hypothetical protein
MIYKRKIKSMKVRSIYVDIIKSSLKKNILSNKRVVKD